jgi:hypothetical protein
VQDTYCQRIYNRMTAEDTEADAPYLKAYKTQFVTAETIHTVFWAVTLHMLSPCAEMKRAVRGTDLVMGQVERWWSQRSRGESLHSSHCFVCCLLGCDNM